MSLKVGQWVRMDREGAFSWVQGTDKRPLYGQVVRKSSDDPRPKVRVRFYVESPNSDGFIGVVSPGELVEMSDQEVAMIEVHRA